MVLLLKLIHLKMHTIDATGTHTIGAYHNGQSKVNILMELISHVNFIDGTAYQASTFGSTDATTGIWKINTNPSVTYGTNGFFMLKDGCK